MEPLGPSRFKVQTKCDWCHVCGRRRRITFGEVWRPRNAEHERDPGKHASYIPVCQACLQTLAEAAIQAVKTGVKDARNYVFNRDDLRVPSDRQLKYRDKRAHPAGKVPGNVWTIPRVCGKHAERIPGVPTQLPLALLRRVVTAAAEPGDLVLDPFLGSGTTGVAAVERGCWFVGIEKNPEYAEIATNPLHGAARTD